MLTHSSQETIKIGQKLANKIKNGGLICLFGDLGSGKTTLTKGLALGLGLKEFFIKSPTYTYIREYRTAKNKIYHIDLYRLEIIDELLWMEISELIENKNNILIIEWADKLADKLSKHCVKVFLKYIDKNTREINILSKNLK